MKDNSTTYRGVSIWSGRVGTSGAFEGRAQIGAVLQRTHRIDGRGAQAKALEAARKLVDRLLPAS